MRILVTGARAPVALDLARRLSAAGHTVVMADSLRRGLAAFSRAIHRFVLLPRPVESAARYADALQHVIREFGIDLLIPTCEEVFCISHCRDQLPCRVVADRFETLARIHNKWQFSRFAGNSFAAVPETRLLTDRSDLPWFLSQSADWVFKPVWSRFAARTLIGPTEAGPSQLQPTAEGPWVAQQRIRGQEYSTWSLCRAGRLLAHACYTSKYRAGQGAGIYFVPAEHPGIAAFVREFVASERFSGQIGFDLIESDDGRLWVLEGNPRATSGLHLFAAQDPLAEVLTEQPALQDRELITPSRQSAVMVEFAMPVWGLADAWRRGLLSSFVPDLCRARCAVWSFRDPLPTLALPASLLELAAVAFREQQTLMQASTRDIEWNGEPL